METLQPAAPPSPALQPVAGKERILALDVVRGFALIGILMMNVEFFNRPISELGSGLSAAYTGWDRVVSFLVQYLVIGKFWTIFSLLFGMGFAVMLTRAEAAGRNFLVPYSRRIAALAVFGACHFIFLWAGDILFSYSVAALGLLFVLFARPIHFIGVLVAMIGLGFVPGCGWAFAIAGGFAFFGMCALWMRNEKRVRFLGGDRFLFGLILTGIALVALVAGIVLNFFPDVPKEPKMALPVLGTVFTGFGLFTIFYQRPQHLRALRLGVALYVLSCTTMLGFGLMQYFSTDPLWVKPGTPAAVAAAEKVRLGVEQAAARPLDYKAPKEAKDEKKDAKKEDQKKLTEAEKLEKRRAEREKGMQEQFEEVGAEIRTMNRGSYLDTVKFRAPKFFEHAPGQFGFATILVGMFLLGSWFVRAGIMDNTEAHLPLFRKMALYGVTFGVGLGLAGSLITTNHVPTVQDGWQLAQAMLMLGNLAACLGYVSLVILALHSRSAFSRIRVLAPLGRMALTNYLMQSLIASFFFYGWGLHHWGISRPMQVVYVAVVITLQCAFSHLWLSRFRYGPMEWLWRAITYWKIPSMRLERSAPMAAVPTAG